MSTGNILGGEFVAKAVLDVLFWVETMPHHSASESGGYLIFGGTVNSWTGYNKMKIPEYVRRQTNKLYRTNKRRFDSRMYRASPSGRKLLREHGIKFDDVGAINPGLRFLLPVGTFITFNALLRGNKVETRQACYVYTMGADAHYAFSESGTLYRFGGHIDNATIVTSVLSAESHVNRVKTVFAAWKSALEETNKIRDKRDINQTEISDYNRGNSWNTQVDLLVEIDNADLI